MGLHKGTDTGSCGVRKGTPTLSVTTVHPLSPRCLSSARLRMFPGGLGTMLLTSWPGEAEERLKEKWHFLENKKLNGAKFVLQFPFRTIYCINDRIWSSNSTFWYPLWGMSSTRAWGDVYRAHHLSYQELETTCVPNTRRMAVWILVHLYSRIVCNEFKQKRLILRVLLSRKDKVENTHAVWYYVCKYTHVHKI